MVGATPAGSISEPSGALRTTWQAACFLDRLCLGKFSAGGPYSQANSGAWLKIDDRRDLPGDDAAIVAERRFPPGRELGSLRVVE